MTQTPSGWSLASLADIADVVGGGTPPTDDPVMWGSDVPWLTPKDLSMNPSRYTTAGTRALSWAGLRQSSARVLPVGSVLVSSRAPIGLVTVARSPISTSQGFRSLVLRCGDVPEYLYYLLGSSKQALEAQANGSTFKEISGSSLKRLLVLLPPKVEQRGIAAMLGALDDKIDSNQRLIEKVQHLSVACFRAWRSSCADTVATTFGHFCDVYGGSTPRTDEPSNWGGPYWWATPTDLTALPAPYLFSTSRTVSDHGLTSCSAALHPPGTIFMTSRATIGAFAVNQEACATNQGFICARPRHDRDRWFLFEEMRMRVPEMLDRANGSTFPELSRRNFKELTLQVPSEEDRDRLTDEVEPLHRLAAQRSQESRGLAELRDALLPELLSGRIRVPEAATN